MTAAEPVRPRRVGRNVALLTGCWAFTSTGNVIMATVSSLVGYQLATDKALATLPAGLMWLGTALATVPASLLMHRFGRRAGFMLGAGIGSVAAALSAAAVFGGSFALLCLGIGLHGVYNAFSYYFRFAGGEAADEGFRSRAISLVLAGGIVGAVAGPELSKWTNAAGGPLLFFGPFVAMVGLAFAVMTVAAFVELPRPPASALTGGRPLGRIAREPAFVVAVIGGVAAYAVMILLMTVTPLAMLACAHNFDDAAFVIQWHVLGMFVPAFFTGHLIRRFGILPVMAAGALLLMGCVGIALAGVTVANFWAALTLLGLGWNFLFVGATTLLAEAHSLAERAKAQGFNELMVFGVAGIASVSSGTLHYYLGWQALNLIALIPSGVALVAVLWLARRRLAPGVPAVAE